MSFDRNRLIDHQNAIEGIVDFHCHHTDPRWPPIALTEGSDPHQLELARQITDIEVLLDESEALGVDYRVLSAPPALLTGQASVLPIDTMRSVNDHLAELVSMHSDHLFGLATIDAFQGDTAAEEVERVVRQLHLPGIVIDCSRDGALLDAAAARPTLQTAASLGVPVFAHPVSPTPLTEELSRQLGRTGVMIARGTASAASLLALVVSGVLDEIADLHIVFAYLGAAGLVHAGMLDAAEPMFRQTASTRRWHVYIDTMGFNPSGVAYAVSLLGSDHVVIGSDWPIGSRRTSRQRVINTLTGAGLSGEEQRDVASATALRLLTNSRSS